MNFVKGYWKSILVCLGILCLSLLHAPETSMHTLSGADKVVHLLMYLILGATLTWESLSKKSSSLLLYMIAVLFPTLYGIAMELIQYFWLSYRTGDIWDIVANFAGVLIGFRLVIFISSKLR